MRMYLFLVLALALMAQGAIAGESVAAKAAEPVEPIKPPSETITSAVEPAKNLPAGRHLTLPEAVRIGLQSATAVQKAKNDKDISGADLLQSYGQFLPNLVATGNYSYTSGNTYYYQSTPTLVATKNYGPSTQIGTTLNLFNGLSDFAGLKSALARQDAASMTLVRAKQQIVVDITQSYLQVVLDSHVVDIAEKNRDSSVERQTLLREQTRVGVRNLSDLYRQEAQTSADQSFLISSQNKRRDDVILLLRKLRLDVNEEYIFDEPNLEPPKISEPAPEEAPLAQKALEKRSDLTAAQARVNANDWSIKSARSGFFPKLDLGLNVFQTGRTLSQQNVAGVSLIPAAQDGAWQQLGEHTYYTVGLTLTWTLFDRFITVDNVEHARVAYDNAQLDYTDTRLQIQGEIRKVLGDYRSAVQQLDTTLKGLQAAQQAFDAVKGRYELGAASFVDLTTAQSTLVQSQTARVQSQTDYILQKKLIEFYSGDTPVED